MSDSDVSQMEEIMAQPTPTEAPVEMDPVEESAMKFTKLLPFISKLANATPSKGSLVRVLTALAEFPLGGKPPRFMNNEERQLFQVMMELNGYKSTVLSSFMKKQMEAEQIKTQAANTVETNQSIE